MQQRNGAFSQRQQGCFLRVKLRIVLGRRGIEHHHREGLSLALLAPAQPGYCGGMARIAWRKFQPFVLEERERTGTQKSWEWFQWLAEQLDLHAVSRTNLRTGAFIAHRDWKP